MVETKLEFLSSTVVNIMTELGRDEVLSRLLLSNESDPYSYVLPSNYSNRIISPKDEICKISPTPFDPTAQEKSESFIRVYYNQGSFDSVEVILEPQLFIDVVVAKDLWLISNKNTKQSLIRPYEIMGRIVSRVGRQSLNGKTKMKFSGFAHLSVNTKFDALRLYCDSFSVER